MIREILASEYELVYKFAEKDIARNYFILLGLRSDKQLYDKIYGEYIEGQLKAILLRRNSGTLQFFAPRDYDLDGFVSLISTLEYTGLIGPRSYCDVFLDKGIFQTAKDGAYISKLGKNYHMKPFKNKYKTRKISVEDLDEIVTLYKEVFSSFAPKKIMEEKLKTKRGRGLCIEDKGKIISVSQTDFETKDGAVIVGIGTRKDYRCKGLATECLQELSRSLLDEGKNLYIQYDNLEAGKIYERLGFKILDQIVHLTK